jgi:uncharacterized protein (TIGR00369 family)
MSSSDRSRVTLDELRAFFVKDFPQAVLTIEEVGPGRARVRHAVTEAELRPGGTVSGPTMMTVADAAAYAAVLTSVGLVPLAVTTSLTINFLRKPSPHAAIIGEATLLKAGRRLIVSEIRIYSEGDDRPVAHATTTYAIP